jgi:hypothetical protein
LTLAIQISRRTRSSCRCRSAHARSQTLSLKRQIFKSIIPAPRLFDGELVLKSG